MHKDSLPEESSSSSKLSSRGISVYYLGSAVFVIGIVLILIGTALVMLFQIHYESQPEQILYTIVAIATGITMILIGINLMIKQTKKGYAIIAISIVFSAIAVFLFATNYLENFYYPLVSFIFGFYVIGFLALLGNAFANVIIWIIGNKPTYITEEKEKPRIYTDEEIQRDIEEATKKSLEAAVADLQFELEDLPSGLVVGKAAPKDPGTVIRVKDDIDEVLSLRQTLAPGTTEKWGSLGIDKASMQLAKTMSQPKKKKKSRFAEFRERQAKKRLAKHAREAKKKKEIERQRQERKEAERLKFEEIKKERELKKRQIEEEHMKKTELKKAQKQAKIREKEAREKAITQAKNKKIEAKKALKEAKRNNKKSSKKKK